MRAELKRKETELPNDWKFKNIKKLFAKKEDMDST